MEKAVEMKVAEFAKANRVNRAKLTTLVEEILALQSKKVSKREMNREAIVEVIAEKGKVSVKDLEAKGMKSVRYMLGQLEAKGLIKKSEVTLKTEKKGRPNYLYEVVA